MATIHYDSSKGAKGVCKASFSMPPKAGIVARRALGPVPRRFLISRRMESEPLRSIVYLAWAPPHYPTCWRLSWLTLLPPGEDGDMETETVNTRPSAPVLGKTPRESQAPKHSRLEARCPSEPGGALGSPEAGEACQPSSFDKQRHLFWGQEFECRH